MSEISVVLPVYNEEDRIGRCLDSLKRQDFHDFEVAVVDNGCTDATIEIVRDYEFTRVIEDFDTLGSARQTGLKEARGSYVAFMDSDEIADPSWLSELYKHREDADAVLGGIKPIEVNTTIARHFQAMLVLDLKYFPSRIKNRSVRTFGSGNVLIDREKALDIGFDRTFPTAEDGDFSYRFLKKGYTISYNPRALVHHEIPNDFAGFFQYYRKLALGSMLLIKKHKNLDLIKDYIIAMLYPISPFYIRRMMRVVGLNFYPIFGLAIFLAYLWGILDFRAYLSPGKVLRPK
ncbi:MAG: glycosyltransferase [Thermoplasmata archaeon]